MSLNCIDFTEFPIDMDALNATLGGMCIFSDFLVDVDEKARAFWQPSELVMSTDANVQDLQQKRTFLLTLLSATPEGMIDDRLKLQAELAQLEAQLFAPKPVESEPKQPKSRLKQVNKADRDDARRFFGHEFMCIACKATHHDQQTPEDRFKSCVLYKKAFCLNCGSKTLSTLTNGQKKGNGKHIANDTSQEAEACIRTWVNEAQKVWKIRRAGALLAERGLIPNFDELYKQLKDANELDSIRTKTKRTPRLVRAPKVDRTALVDDVAATVEELAKESKAAALKAIDAELALLDDAEYRDKAGISYQHVGAIKKIIRKDFVAVTMGHLASSILQKETAEERIALRVAAFKKSLPEVVEMESSEKIKITTALLDTFVREQVSANAELKHKAVLKAVKKHFFEPAKSFDLKRRVKQIMKDCKKKKASRPGLIKLLTAAMEENRKLKFEQALEAARQKYSDVDRDLVTEVFAELHKEQVAVKPPRTLHKKTVQFAETEKEAPQPKRRKQPESTAVEPSPKRQKKTTKGPVEEATVIELVDTAVPPKRQKKEPEAVVSDLPTMAYLSGDSGAGAAASLKILSWPKLAKFFASVHPSLATVTQDYTVTKKALISKFTACFWEDKGQPAAWRKVSRTGPKPEAQWPACAATLLSKLAKPVRDKSPVRKNSLPAVKAPAAKPQKTARHGMIDIMYQLEKMIEIDLMKDRQTGKTGRTAFLQVKAAVYNGLYDENPIEWQRKLESLCISKNATTAFGLEKVKQRLASLLQTSNATRATLIESLHVEEPSKPVEEVPVQPAPKQTCEWFCDTHTHNWIDGCKGCDKGHMIWHMRNEDIRDDGCSLCGPKIRQRKEEEAKKRKQAGIEKRKKTIAEKKLAAKPVESLPVEEESSESSSSEPVDFEEVNLASSKSSSEIEEQSHDCSVDLVERPNEMAEPTDVVLDKQFERDSKN